jgi:ABC-type branched-subunit amino acid transport system substrate-binding protein
MRLELLQEQRKIMKMTTIKRWTILAAVALWAIGLANVLAQSAAQQPLTMQEKRGKQIYLRATSPSGKPILAYLGNPPVEMPATAMTCAGCHGLDGRGKPEGGVTPPNVTWEALTKPGAGAKARNHPPYTERTLEIAIQKGFDAGGNRLGPAMPRFAMSPADLSDLIAYLKRLGKDTDPGLSPSAIRLGTLIPADGPLSEAGEAVSALLAAYFDEVNNLGGIYNRKIEWRVCRLPKESADKPTSVDRFLKDEGVFALAAPFIAGSEKQIASVAESEEVPLIGPFTLMPQSGFPLNRQIFYLLPGLLEQSRAMANFARQKLGQTRRVAIVFPSGDLTETLAAAIEDQCRKTGLSLASKVTYSAAQFDALRLANDLSKVKAEAVFFLGSAGDGYGLLVEAEKLGWLPDVFIPGALIGPQWFDAPRSFKEHIFLSFPTLPSDQTKPMLLELRALAEKQGLSTKHLAMLASAYSSAKVLVEALKLAGRDVSREKLITTLEGFYEFETGLTPRLTFGPNRRIGALGAYIVRLDLEKKGYTPASAWVLLN